jgi:hypothetical protein
LFKVVELANALESACKAITKCAEACWSEWVTIRSKFDGATPCCNGLVKVVELANALEAALEGNTEVIETRRLV